MTELTLFYFLFQILHSTGKRRSQLFKFFTGVFREEKEMPYCYHFHFSSPKASSPTPMYDFILAGNETGTTHYFSETQTATKLNTSNKAHQVAKT